MNRLRIADCACLPPKRSRREIRTWRETLLVVVCALTILVIICSANAQQQKSMPVVGIVLSSSRSSISSSVDAFLQSLNALGYKDGQTVTLVWREPEGKSERIPAFVTELLSLNVDILVAGHPMAAVLAAKATKVTPIVFVGAANPVELGLVASLARPGGNVTGVSWNVTPDTMSKLLEFAKEILPKAARATYLYDAQAPGHVPHLRALADGAQGFRIELGTVSASRPDDYDTAFAAIMRERPDALVVAPNPSTLVNRQRIAEFARQNRLPSFFASREYADAGGLLAYGPSRVDLFRRTAGYVDKIFKGANPGDLPVEQPTKFDLVINLKTAKALGLTIPQSLLTRADEVIE